MARPVTPAARRALARVARYGVYFWTGDLALLADPWRSAVHVGSVRSLLRRGLLEPTDDSMPGLRASSAGLEVLAEYAAASTAAATYEHAGVFVEVTAEGFKDPDADRLVARRVIDMLRLSSRSSLEWEAIVDIAVAGQPDAVLASMLQLAALSVEPDDSAEFELGISFTPLAVASAAY